MANLPRGAIDYPLLINRECELVKQGNSAEKLAELLKEYEFSITRAQQFTKEEVVLYFTALILSGKFLELKFVIRRYNTKFSKNEIELYKNLAAEALDKNFEKLIPYAKELQTSKNCELNGLIFKSIKRYILNSLSKSYLTIELQFLQKNYGIDHNDVTDNSYEVQGKYVKFNERNNEPAGDLSQLMYERVRQLSSITENIVKKAN